MVFCAGADNVDACLKIISTLHLPVSLKYQRKKEPMRDCKKQRPQDLITCNLLLCNHRFL